MSSRMTTASHTTLREAALDREQRPTTPVLLVGSFVPQSAHVIRVERTATIGRARTADAGDGTRDADVTLHADSALSRPHLRITAERDGWLVEDLGSTNGTFVDGRRLTKPARLSEGSIVSFGSHEDPMSPVHPDLRVVRDNVSQLRLLPRAYLNRS